MYTSGQYQPERRMRMGAVVIPVNLGADSYEITLERGALGRAGEILNLRRKVEEDPSNPRLIRTVWGKGYQID